MQYKSNKIINNFEKNLKKNTLQALGCNYQTLI